MNWQHQVSGKTYLNSAYLWLELVVDVFRVKVSTEELLLSVLVFSSDLIGGWGGVEEVWWLSKSNLTVFFLPDALGDRPAVTQWAENK